MNKALEIADEHHGLLFLFVNVSATRVPHEHYFGESADTWQCQYAALAYADQHLGHRIRALSREKSWLVIMCADHGDAPDGDECAIRRHAPSSLTTLTPHDRRTKLRAYA